MTTHRVTVIGGGVGGLAAAIRLCAGGTAVRVLEAGPRLGGKLNRWTATVTDRSRPFQFDMGPSLLTLPLVLADLFAAAGRDIRKALPIHRLHPISRFVWGDGQAFQLTSDRAELQRQIGALAPDDLGGFERFLTFGRKVWDLSGDLFLSQSPEQALRGDGTFSPGRALAMLTVPLRIGMFQKYAVLVDKYIQNQRLREVLYQYATYSGASPFLAPATLAVIPHVELEMGGWYVSGGMYTIAEQLEKLARELGVEIRLNTPVARILTEGHGKAKKAGTKRVRGVALADGSIVEADAVICNADVMYAYRELIAPEDRPSWSNAKLAKVEPGGSGMVLLLGVDGTYPQLAHHTKFMPDDYTSDLRAMFETRTIPDDPCIYVCASTRTDPTQAPPGCENLFVLCSAPPLDGTIDWAIEGPKYRDKIIATLEHKFGLTDLSKRILVERRITPADLKSMYNANAGSIYGISSNGVKQAFLRPPNRDRDIKGLFFAGGATHPGGGLPLVALSGKIAAELATEYLNGL